MISRIPATKRGLTNLTVFYTWSKVEYINFEFAKNIDMIGYIQTKMLIGMFVFSYAKPHRKQLRNVSISKQKLKLSFFVAENF